MDQKNYKKIFFTPDKSAPPWILTGKDSLEKAQKDCAETLAFLPQYVSCQLLEENFNPVFSFFRDSDGLVAIKKHVSAQEELTIAIKANIKAMTEQADHSMARDFANKALALIQFGSKASFISEADFLAFYNEISGFLKNG